MKKETTYGLTPERLSRLLAIGLERGDEEDKPSGDRSVAEVVRDTLFREPVLDPAKPDSVPAVLGRECAEMQPAAGRTIAGLLLDSKTDLAVVKTLKEYGKELVRRGGTEPDQATATVIYYTAIASALLFHRRRITEHSCEKLEKAYGDLEQKDWIPSELKELFRKAKAACQERQGDAG